MDEPDAFAVLNVPIDADDEAIDRAWKRKLRIVHPDRHPHATAQVRELLEHRTQELNDAHDTLMDPARRAELGRARRDRDAGRARAASSTSSRQSRTRTRRPPERPRRPGCERCGGLPVASYRFLQVRGVPFAKVAEDEETLTQLCRPCALAAGRDHLNLALGKAWFVSVPLLSSLEALWVNARAVRRARVAAVPTDRGAGGAHPGLPVPFRWGALVFAATTVVIIGALVAGLLAPERRPVEARRVPGEIVEVRPAHPGRYENRRDGTPGRTSYEFSPGGCVVGSSVMTPVPCDQPHSGSIAGTAFSVEQCPTGTDAVIPGQEVPVCIDLDR